MRTTYELLFDWDDVVYPLCSVMQKMADRAGISEGRRITQWQAHEDFGVTADELWGMFHSDLDYFYGQPLIPGALAQMRRLRAYGHRIHIVTARGSHDSGMFYGISSDVIQGITRDQIRRSNVPLDSLTFAKDKAPVALELGVDWAIDDKPANVAELLEVGVSGALMDAVHNQDAAGFLRVFSVQEFADLVINSAGHADIVRDRVA